jgi:hypothetical protein
LLSERHPARAVADGGYGGSDTNYRYSFVLPDNLKQDTVSKTEKAVNGTDVLYVQPGTRDGAPRGAHRAPLKVTRLV